MTNMNLTKNNMKCSSFSSTSGVQESFITGVATEGLALQEALDELAASYMAALQDNALDTSTQQFVRIFISDIYNEHATIIESELYNIASKSAFSMIEQGPLGGSEVGIFAYHITSDDDAFKQKIISADRHYNNQNVFAEGKNYSLLWTSNYSDYKGEFKCEKQTQTIFAKLSDALHKHGMTIRNNMVRTWIFVRDVDNHYKDMVKARREYFETIGLTAKTRYIASTGIEGKMADPGTLVHLDALSVQNIKESQIVRMMALENLSNTIDYGVTFERGFRIRYGDRSHIYISGTASIDSAGNTLYLSDIRKQTERTLDNIEALLKPQGAVMGDMKYLIIYLRNSKHWSHIQDILISRIPDSVATIPALAPVCRPNWLVEIEGLGIIPDSTDFPPFA
jgi:enamine deaminase RidA (YjgF/YER057c/UK114 family)